MASTYEPIATTTLGTAAATITFSSISSSYTDLKIVLVGTTTGSVVPAIRLNGDTASNYSDTYLTGDGASVTSGRTTSSTEMFITENTTTSTTVPIMINLDILSYRSAVNKTVLSSNSADKNGSGVVERVVGLWRNTAAITSVELRARSSTWATGTTATLYGILKA